MSEHEDQQALFCWMRLHEAEYPELHFAFAIPNGTRTTPRVAAKMKAEGVLKGVSDIFLPAARGGRHGLFIEMKTDKGRLSPEQSAFLEAMNAAGYHAVMCRGWEQAAEAILDYLGKET